LTSDPPARLRALLDRPATMLRALGEADAVVAPSHFLADVFARNGLSRERVHVIPYGLADGRIVPIPTPRPRTPLRLGFCGVLSPWKAPHLAIEAVRSSRANVTLAIHGNADETMFAEYIARCRAAAGGDPRIVFAGPYGEEDTGRVFAGLDALVVPSTWYENTPFVVLEAFAAGVPVVASDLGGLAEVVQHERNGLLFRAGDAAALREAIERLASDPGLLARLHALSSCARSRNLSIGGPESKKPCTGVQGFSFAAVLLTSSRRASQPAWRRRASVPASDGCR
jgi:glycosyltransferase involved in cell wall biosynthesis